MLMRRQTLNLLFLKMPLLPVTVQDQIRLWELERNRLKSREGTRTLLEHNPFIFLH